MILKLNKNYIIIFFAFLILSGFLYAIPASDYAFAKLFSMVAVVLFFLYGNKNIAKLGKNNTYINYCYLFTIITIVIAIYSFLVYDETILQVFNICGEFFGILFYIVLLMMKVDKEKVEDIFINVTLLIVIAFFVQYFIYLNTDRIFFIDFENTRMRAGFFRVGVGENFVGISVVILFGRLISKYEFEHVISKKFILEIALFLYYYCMYICTRAGLVAIGAAIVMMVLMGTNKKRLKIFMILVIIVSLYFIINSSIFEKYLIVDKIEGGGSIYGRINAYKYYFEHFLQYPFLGNGFLYPDSYETKLLLYGPAGHYYLDDVGVIGFIFTTGIAGLLWLIGLAIKVLKNIVIMYKSKVLYKNPEVIGVLAYIVVTMPTLFICSYGKICFLPILLYILTPSKK